MKKQYTIDFIKKEISKNNARFLVFFYVVPLMTSFILYFAKIINFESTIILFVFLWLFNMQKVPIKRTIVEIEECQKETNSEG